MHPQSVSGSTFQPGLVIPMSSQAHMLCSLDKFKSIIIFILILFLSSSILSVQLLKEFCVRRFYVFDLDSVRVDLMAKGTLTKLLYIDKVINRIICGTV